MTHEGPPKPYLESITPLLLMVQLISTNPPTLLTLQFPQMNFWLARALS